MSNQIPSREERLRRAHESAERIKNQWDIANDVYDDVRDVISTENPQMEDFELPEAIERRSAETINLEEEAKAWQQEIKHLKERNMRYEQELEKLGDDIRSSQMTDDEPDDITQQRLRHLTRLIEGYPKLATLLFQDEAHFQPAIQNMKRSGNQLLSKLHNLHGEVNEIRVDIRDALKDYTGRLNNLVKPLQKELAETQDQLESAQTLQTTTDAELTKVKEELQEVMEQHQTLEKSLQDEIDKSKAEISDLKKEAVMASRQNASYQAEIVKLKSEEATTMRYLSTEIESVTAENVRAKAQNMQLEETLSLQNSQHKAEIQAMTENEE